MLSTVHLVPSDGNSQVEKIHPQDIAITHYHHNENFLNPNEGI